MRLRHYLKGLGIGMVVTALILHFSVQAAEPSMTDEEVIARARELGMMENVVLSRNDPALSGGSVSDEDIVSTSGNMVADDSGDPDDIDDPQSDEEGTSAEDDGNITASAGGSDIGPETSGHENVSDVTENGDVSVGDPAEDDIPSAAGNDDEVETEPQEGMAGAEAEEPAEPVGITEPVQNSDTVTVTVYNGDSSVSVAGKLAALGLVSSQAEYDKYLCSHGYDRTIRTGVHVIPVGATEQQIAEIITSKP
ncbi:MAG: hypothetical protein K2K20_00830 [Lachnospiraceae bacterium]|nr:hypothetical protein [Lachnospiraceae bacterium]